MSIASLRFVIAESHRIVEIAFEREKDYKALDGALTTFRVNRRPFELVALDQGYSLHVEFDAAANYIEGSCNQTDKLISIRVAEDWIDDIIVVWSSVRPNSNKYENHQYFLNCKKDAKRGTTRKGYSLQFEYHSKSAGITGRYELRQDASR